jgi:branched-chain amino acid aminotransferase
MPLAESRPDGPGTAPATAPVAAATCWWDGDLLPLERARVSVDAAAMRYAQVVFDGCAAFFTPDGRVMRILDLAAHLARFRRSCAGLGLELSYSDDELAAAVTAVVRDWPHRDPVGVRLFGFSTDEGFLSDRPASVCVFLRSLVGYAPDRPLRLAMAAEPRPAHTDLPRWVKATAHYAGARRSVIAARRAGYDDVLFRNESGRITESSRASILSVIGGELTAPPVEEGVLPGITRELLGTVAAAELGLRIRRRPLELDELLAADGVVACSSSLGVAVVGEIEGHDVRGRGLAQTLAASFARAARGESGTLDHLVTPVELSSAGRDDR